MSLPALDNLVRVGQLKAEPRNDAEIKRMLAMARVRLADSNLATLSPEGRFTSAYNAAHAAALATLRWHATRWRVLDAAHQKRNLAEYEGFLEIEESAIDELRNAVAGLIQDVAKITG